LCSAVDGARGHLWPSTAEWHPREILIYAESKPARTTSSLSVKLHDNKSRQHVLMRWTAASWWEIVFDVNYTARKTVLITRSASRKNGCLCMSLFLSEEKQLDFFETTIQSFSTKGCNLTSIKREGAEKAQLWKKEKDGSRSYLLRNKNTSTPVYAY